MSKFRRSDCGTSPQIRRATAYVRLAGTYPKVSPSGSIFRGINFQSSVRLNTWFPHLPQWRPSVPMRAVYHKRVLLTSCVSCLAQSIRYAGTANYTNGKTEGQPAQPPLPTKHAPKKHQNQTDSSTRIQCCRQHICQLSDSLTPHLQSATKCATHSYISPNKRNVSCAQRTGR